MSTSKRNKSRRKRHSGNEETIFMINDENNGRLDDRPLFRARKNESADSLPSEKRSSPKHSDKHRNIGSAPGKKEPLGLRIIGGRFRGSKLAYAGDNRVRPMKDRVREAVFNLIGPTVKGKHVIDLFAGTGALAIEAISRGAVGGTLLEMHFPTARNARQNLQSLELESLCRLIVTDAFFWSHTRESAPTETPWLVFCSPPYDFFTERADEMIALLLRLREAAPADSLFVVEADNRFDFGSIPVEITEKRRRSYPPAEIALFQ